MKRLWCKKNPVTGSAIKSDVRAEDGLVLKRNVHPRDVHSEEGSAVVEFVLIATPLFIPALLFFMSMHNTALEEIRVENLARQTVRAFVTAESLAQGHQRIKYVLDRYSEIESRKQNPYGFTYNVSCGGQKCLTPGSHVTIELFRSFETNVPDNTSRKAVAVASGVVDKWRE